VLSALPERLRGRTLVAAAADKFYGSRKKRTWWYSLFHGTFPVSRGGGTKQLEYPLSLFRRGWSILIYPEGGRSKSGQVQRFKHGVAIMAMQAKVPVIPVYIEGLRDVMPKGQRTPQAAAVSGRIGAPVSLEGVASVPEGTAMLENAMRALAGMPPHRADAPAAQPAAASAPGGS
jgi:1-acyl-sn-glycerol-3-phosphate acyltransferase